MGHFAFRGGYFQKKKKLPQILGGGLAKDGTRPIFFFFFS